MNSSFLFLGGCIPTRLLLALLAYKIKPELLPYLGVLFLGIGISFLYLYLTNSRLNAREAGGNTWWADYRPIHGMFYITAGIYALKKNKMSSLLILIDTLVGLGLFINHRLFI